MRVAHVITRLIVGGAQENTTSTVLGLHEKPGVNVRLYCGPTTGPEGSLEPLVQKVDGLFHRVPNLIRPVRPLSDWLAYRQLKRAFASFRPDIVHTHSGKAGFIGRLAAKRAGVPKIIHSIHGPSFGLFQGWATNALFRGAERFAGRMTDHFVTVADAMRDQYLSAGISQADDYTRIPSGFDLQPFLDAENSPTKRASLGLSPGDFVVGKIARLFELKGHDDLFAIAPRLARRIPNIRFLLVGDGVWRGRFERLAKEIGCGQNFIFTGLVPPSEIPSLVGVMDALVHLSRPAARPAPGHGRRQAGRGLRLRRRGRSLSRRQNRPPHRAGRPGRAGGTLGQAGQRCPIANRAWPSGPETRRGRIHRRATRRAAVRAL